MIREDDVGNHLKANVLISQIIKDKISSCLFYFYIGASLHEYDYEGQAGV